MVHNWINIEKEELDKTIFDCLNSYVLIGKHCKCSTCWKNVSWKRCQNCKLIKNELKGSVILYFIKNIITPCIYDYKKYPVYFYNGTLITEEPSCSELLIKSILD